MKLAPLSALFPGSRDAAQPVALRRGAAASFGELRMDVEANAAGLATLGLRRGLLVAEDSYWFLVGLLAILHAGGEAVLPPNAQPGTLRSLGAEADLLLGDGVAAGGYDLRAARSCGGGRAALTRLDSAAPRLRFFTSGSTGERKAIAKSLAQLEREVETLEWLWGERLGSAPFLGMVSHQHIFGLTFRMLWPLAAGRPFSAITHFAWESLLAELPPGAVVVASPAHLNRTAGLAAPPPGRRPLDVITAGAPLPLAAAREAEELFGVLPLEIFGSTETGAVAWRRQARPAAPWRPLPGVELRRSAAGTLQVRSPFLPDDAPHASADLVEMDADGFHLLGRADRIVKVEGKRVSLPEVERELSAISWVEAAAVAPIDALAPTLGAAIVLTRAGRAALAEHGAFRLSRMIRASLAATQEPAALPRRWRFVASLPLDAMGKRPQALVATLFERPRRARHG